MCGQASCSPSGKQELAGSGPTISPSSPPPPPPPPPPWQQVWERVPSLASVNILNPKREVLENHQRFKNCKMYTLFPSISRTDRNFPNRKSPNTFLKKDIFASESNQEQVTLQGAQKPRTQPALDFLEADTTPTTSLKGPFRPCCCACALAATLDHSVGPAPGGHTFPEREKKLGDAPSLRGMPVGFSLLEPEVGTRGGPAALGRGAVRKLTQRLWVRGGVERLWESVIMRKQEELRLWDKRKVLQRTARGWGIPQIPAPWSCPGFRHIWFQCPRGLAQGNTNLLEVVPTCQELIVFSSACLHSNTSSCIVLQSSYSKCGPKPTCMDMTWETVTKADSRLPWSTQPQLRTLNFEEHCFPSSKPMDPSPFHSRAPICHWLDG